MNQDSALLMLETLTSAQIDVLDRILLHKTSKEIARELGISPYTVDQRVKSAWEKLGATGRASAARKYAAIKSICGQTAYESSGMDYAILSDAQAFQDLPAEATFVIEDSMQSFREFEEPGLAVPKALDARFGRFGRLIAVLVCAALIAIVVLTISSIAVTMGDLV